MEKNKKSAIDLVKEIHKELASYRSQFESDWKSYDNAYYGRQHKTGEEKKTVKNHIFKAIETEVPILTDSMPGTQLIAELEEKQEDANNLERAIRYVYQDQNLPLILPSLVRSSLTSAPGFLYVYYDPDAEMGEGKICYREMEWGDVWLDGNASTIEQATRAKLRFRLRREDVLRIHPDKEEELKEITGKNDDSESVDDDNYEDRDVSKDGGVKGVPKRVASKDILEYFETWVRDFTLGPIDPEKVAKDIEEERVAIENQSSPNIRKYEPHDDHIKSHLNQRAELLIPLGVDPAISYEELEKIVTELAQQNPQFDTKILLKIKIIDNHIEEHEHMKKLNPTGGEPKFKDGWRVIKTVGSVVLSDTGNTEENGMIPLVPFYCYKDKTIYGFGEVKNIIDAQRKLNEMDFKELKGLRRVANPGWVADSDSGVDEKNLHNDEGIVIKKNRGTEVRRLEPGTVSPQIENRKQYEIKSIDDLSGLGEASQGRMPSPTASGVTVERLQTQAIGRIRLKDRYLQHYSMKRLALITASFIINNWTSEKRLRLRGEGNSIESFVFDPIRMSDLKYTVEIAPGSMAGVDKDSLNAFYLNLLNGGHIQIQDFLLVAELPKKEILIKALSERTDMQAQAEAKIGEIQAQAEEQALQLNAQLEEMVKQNIKLKSLVNPELLSPEEQKMLQEMQRESALDQALNGNYGANEGQPENQGI